eukprot:2990539-Amphidinium_carterae.1
MPLNSGRPMRPGIMMGGRGGPDEMANACTAPSCRAKWRHVAMDFFILVKERPRCPHPTKQICSCAMTFGTHFGRLLLE